MKIKLIPIIVFLIPSVYGFERITSPEDALSKELDVIHLIGENHGDEQDIDQQKLLTKLANEGDVILGLEGLSEEEEHPFHSTLFGFEEPFLKGATVACWSLVSLLKHVAYKKLVGMTDSSSNGNEYDDNFSSLSHKMKETFNSMWRYLKETSFFKAVFSYNEYGHIYTSERHRMNIALNGIWGYLKIAITINKDAKEIAFFLSQLDQNKVLMNIMDAINKDPDGTLHGDGSIYKHLGKNSIDDNFYDNLSSDNHEWFVLLKQAVQYHIGKSALDGEAIESLHALLSELNGLYEEIEICTDRFRINQILDRLMTIHLNETVHIALNLRNEVFLRNICLAYRAYNEKKHLDKPFFIIVGKLHVAFLKENLIAQGFAVAVNDGVYDYGAEELAKRSEL